MKKEQLLEKLESAYDTAIDDKEVSRATLHRLACDIKNLKKEIEDEKRRQDS